MAHRQGHFMPTALLDSQFATLQPLRRTRRGSRSTSRGSPEEIAAPCRRRALGELDGARGAARRRLRGDPASDARA